jgi:hypothetical protein
LTDDLPAGGVKKDARFWILTTPTEDGNNSGLLEASGDTTLQSPCPGLFSGKDLGYPVILHLTNDTHQARILGGMVVYMWCISGSRWGLGNRKNERRPSGDGAFFI